jgi:DegV family protein with EDD domain
MKIVTDTASNITLAQANELGVEVVPFCISFMGKSYLDAIDITPENLYRMLSEHPEEFPSTSQPSVGDFVTAFEKYRDEEIISVNLSSGLSGSYSSAIAAAHLVSDARVTVVDSRVVGPLQGWMVEIAAMGAQRGWTKERILESVKHLKENSLTLVAFQDLKYLIHGGRIDHLHAIVGSLLKLKPIIGMNDKDGKYINLGQEMTMSRTVRKMTDLVLKRFGEQKLRLQLMHGYNLPGVNLLRVATTELLDCVEDKLVSITPVLGAHAGPTVFGLAAMPVNLINQLSN